MRQSNGVELFGENDPRSKSVGLIDIEPEDDRQSILTAILTQDKLGRKQTVLVCPDENKALRRAADLEQLDHTLQTVRTQLVFVVSQENPIARFARRKHLPIFLSLEKYVQYAQTFLTASEEESGTEAPQEEETEHIPANSSPPPIEEEPLPAPQEPSPSVEEVPSTEEYTDSVHEEEQPQAVPSVSSPFMAEHAPVGSSVEAASPRNIEHEDAKRREEHVITVTMPPKPRSVPISSSLVFRRRRKRRRPTLVLVLLLLLLLLLGAGVVSTMAGIGPLAALFPGTSATIVITPTVQQMNRSYTVLAVSQFPDITQQQVAARFLSATTAPQMKTVAASGRGTIAAEAARGMLTFYNAFPYVQTVSSGTVFTDENGVQVVSDQVATIPAATPPTEGSITVSAHALVQGNKGNIPATDFKAMACCHAGITVENTAPFNGGRDQQMYSYVEQTDIDATAQDLSKALVQDGQQAVQGQMLPNEQLIGGVKCTPAITSDHAAGDKTSSLTVLASVTCQGEAFDRQGAQVLAEDLLKSDAQKLLGGNYAAPGHIITTIEDVHVQDTRGTIALRVQVSGNWTAQFDRQQQQTFVRMVQGKSVNDAQTVLARQWGVRRVAVTVVGSFSHVLPKDPWHIHIIIHQT